MSIIQNLKVKMIEIVLLCLKANMALLEKLPGYLDKYNALDNNLSTINKASIEQAYNKKGFAERKAKLRKKLIELDYSVCTKLVVFAQNTQNNVLKQEISYTLSELERMTEKELETTSNCIADRAIENLAELADYLVTGEMTDRLRAAIKAYANSRPEPQEKRNKQKLSTQQLVHLLKEADALLADIDAIVEMVRDREPDFYSSYRLSRLLPKQGTSAIALKGFINDITTGEGIKNAKIIIAAVNDDGKMLVENGAKIVKKSAKQGGFIIKNMDTGVYRITVRKAGYEEQVLTVSVNNGEMTSAKILLKKTV